ncbi:YopX family protein [Bariatricus sp. HCP3S3_E12]|uniref:YopX family protein n=1 Tax=Bariatricus sp. HCP3S3_E12 TaxID=3438906 RepID=UPI003F8C3932
MNDRYLYRAKRMDNGEWVEGFLFQLCYDSIFCWCIGNEPLSPNDYSELCGFNREWFYIDESTICQCTALRDKNGKLIWENDICIITDGTLDEEDGYFRLDWEIDRAMFEFEGTGICANFDNVSGYDCEVVGNIFDNPELLEVEE